MIRINQIKLQINHSKEDLLNKIYKLLKVNAIESYSIYKQSIDARKKQELKYIYSVDVLVNNESKILDRIKSNDILAIKEKEYEFKVNGNEELDHPPVIVGMGPAGIFAGLYLAKAGYKPIIIEQGRDVDTRVEDVEKFWESGALNPISNIQFGEGGAGTFSDGKLNTLVKDKYGRNRAVLQTFVEYGAPEEILYINKPHIGTDLLRNVVKNMRNAIIEFGGQVHFDTKLTKIVCTNKVINGIEVCNNNIMSTIPCNSIILAIGHSARDTFYMLKDSNLSMEPKPFAVGVRIEHPREMINKSQYGSSEDAKSLPTASYKVTHRASNGRNVYSFCMCPGGFVVNASSEDKRLVVNGMSNHDRNSDNSNSAIIVNVTPEDFYKGDVLDGVEFQRDLEEKAYITGKGNIPVQLFGDFVSNVPSTKLGRIAPCIKGKYTLSNLNDCLPSYVINAIIDGVFEFDKKISGYARKDAVLSGVETRTSSPVKILRDDLYESNIKGIYPCGEGAGYAGGITSAAMDGIKVAEAIAEKYKPF